MEDDTQPQSEKSSAVEEEESITPETVFAESKSFLEYLLESNPTYPELDTSYEEFNGDTLRAGNGENHNRQISALSDLFDPPKPSLTATTATTTKSKEESTKIASYEEFNRETVRVGNGEKSNRQPVSASDLFDPPEPSLTTTTTSNEESTMFRPPSPSKTLKSTPTTRMSPRKEVKENKSLSHQKQMKAAHTRDRTVSFDRNPQYYEPNTTQDPIGEQFANNIPPLPLSRATSNESRQNAHNRNKTLTIDDIVGAGPYELEAETHLIKIIEEHNQIKAHQRYRSDSSSILSNVPDGIAHSFSSDGDDGEEEKKIEDPMPPNENEQPRPTPRDPVSGDKQSISSSKDTKKSQPQKPKRSHRRHMSVEDRLAGLTVAMKNLDHIKNESDTGTIMKPEFIIKGSAAEQLGYNAVQIIGDDFDQGPPPKREQRTQNQELLDPVTEEVDAVGDSDSDEERDIEAQQTEGTPNGSSAREKRKSSLLRRSSVFVGAADKFKEDWEIWQSFFSPRKDHVFAYMRHVTIYGFVPFIGVAAILFYLVDNPPTGKGEDSRDTTSASASWWLLFGVRQAVTFSMALFLQMVIIDFLCIGTRAVLRLLGPMLTLLLVQSKGWPFVVFTWSICNFCTLYGNTAFAHHWGYWQQYVGLFNEDNPSGHVVDSTWNKSVLLIGVTVSLTVALKRFIIGIYLGRQTFGHYGDQLARVMNKLVMISEVANLARRMERATTRSSQNRRSRMPTIHLDKASFYGHINIEDDDISTTSTLKTMKTIGDDKVIDPNNRDPLTGSLSLSEKRKIATLLDRWEEPDRQKNGLNEQISISSVLRFRNALNLIKNDYPFSYAFGPAYSRESCIESSQEVYSRLCSMNPDDRHYLHFDTLAVLALEHGEIDQQKAKDLIKIFRPDREGGLILLDFVKSTDAVYKEFRLLQASIDNSSHIDRAFENIINIIFYTILITIILSQFGLDPLALFLSLSSVILAFAFMIGSASSKYFEGLLFILVRRPYGIGDLIHVSDVEQDTPPELGAPCWIVQNVTLFETIVKSLRTQEIASLSNGSLASSRIINWARSPHARFNIQLTFPIETPYNTLECFKRAIEEYLKIRPREWIALNGFRVNRIATDKGFVQVVLTVQHRESWQNIGQCLDSRANMISYCQEVQKLLGMKYSAPPLPIDFRNFNPKNLEGAGSDETSTAVESEKRKHENDDYEDAQVQQFQNMARTRHHIFL